MLDVPRKFFTAFVVFTFCAATFSVACFAEDAEKTNTVVTFSEMHGGCVRKILKRFEDEEVVSKIECNIEKKTITLVP